MQSRMTRTNTTNPDIVNTASQLYIMAIHNYLRPTNLPLTISSTPYHTFSNPGIMSQQRRNSMKESLREKWAKMRKRPHVTGEQKLQVRIDSMNTEATELDAQCQALKSKAGVFTARAESTPMPASPPPDREPLFERDPKAPPSQYDAQVKAYGILIGEWHLYEKEIKSFGKKLDHFEETVEAMKKKTVEPGQAIGKKEHEFIGLDNALFKLKEQRTELSRVVAAVPLPAEK